MGFLSRRVLTAALTANAIRTLPDPKIAAASFLPGWFVGELAPQLLAATAADTAIAVARGRAGRTGLVLAGATAAGLGYLVWQGYRSHRTLDAALEEGLGADYVERLDAPPSPGDYATPWRSLARPFHWSRPDVEVLKDIRYFDAGRRGLLDVSRPKGAVPRGAPVLLQVHGGGWVLGSKDQQGVPLSLHMAARGWVVVSINYRLAPRDAFPAQIVDVKRAIAWVREHIADYGGDPSYVVITGGSAGGQLCALAALTPSDPEYQPGFEDADTSLAAAVPHYGVYDMAGVTGLASAARMRDTFLAPESCRRRTPPTPSCSRKPPPSPGSRRRRPTSSSSTVRATRWSTSTRGVSSSAGCARCPATGSCTPSCPAPSTPSTCSTRSAPYRW
ncbi:MAG: alpha/beta hydrolase [Nocardioides sp.]